jgi:hypothetical protein
VGVCRLCLVQIRVYISDECFLFFKRRGSLSQLEKEYGSEDPDNPIQELQVSAKQ